MITKEQEVFYNEGGILVRRATLADAKILSLKLSEHDKREAWAIDHLSPLEALTRGLDKSILAFTLENKEVVIGMMGIIPDQVLGDRAQVWFLASDELKTIGRVFLLNVGSVLSIFLSYYKYIYNYVHAENKGSIVWMKWVGFKVEDAKPFGADQELFHYFYIESEK